MKSLKIRKKTTDEGLPAQLETYREQIDLQIRLLDALETYENSGLYW